MDKVTKDKLDQYRDLTSKALEIAKNSIIKNKKKEANEIITMVKNYLSDSNYFESKGDFVSAFSALSYAHGWLDSGARLGIFDVKDSRFFTIK
ncbi:MAG TPA: DUF357 domain-containing protein [Candidatus Nanoarchaeia archaeon]|nr:DUF357 domain-containing protein [Candidatus Nanoarchaeia archaeon]